MSDKDKEDEAHTVWHSGIVGRTVGVGGGQYQYGDGTELEALPGIGPAKAKAIVAYRQQNGQFKTVEDLKKVKGIGEGIFSKLKDEASVAPAAAKKAVPAVKP